MDPTVVQYIGFVVAMLIISWALIELNQRRIRRKKVDTPPLTNWVKLDPAQTYELKVEEKLVEDDDEEEASIDDLHTRAKQNGHYSESKKKL